MYSQYDEEKHILGIFEGKAEGTLIDVGAFNGRTFSNTLKLIEDGWGGILVEPSAQPFHDLAALHGHNPRLRLVNAAVVPGDGGGLIKLEMTDDAVSTTSEAFRRIWAHVGNYIPVYVSPVGVAEIERLYHSSFGGGQPDFINVDTEGTSLEVATALAERFTPAAWCVEFRVGPASFEEQFRQLFKGYDMVHRAPDNLIFRLR
jgi:FkbM family methyltransferase